MILRKIILFLMLSLPVLAIAQSEEIPSTYLIKWEAQNLKGPCAGVQQEFWNAYQFDLEPAKVKMQYFVYCDEQHERFLLNYWLEANSASNISYVENYISSHQDLELRGFKYHFFKATGEFLYLTFQPRIISQTNPNELEIITEQRFTAFYRNHGRYLTFLNNSLKTLTQEDPDWKYLTTWVYEIFKKEFADEFYKDILTKMNDLIITFGNYFILDDFSTYQYYSFVYELNCEANGTCRDGGQGPEKRFTTTEERAKQFLKMN